MGCNNGRLVTFLCEKNINTFGLDISVKALQRNKESFFTLDIKSPHGSSYNFFIGGNAKCMPIKATSFDFIVCSASFHHFSNKKSAIKEFRRVLKPNGKIIIVEPNRKNIFYRFKRFVTSWTEFFSGNEEYFQREELEKIFSRDFHIEQSQYISNFFILLIPFLYEVLCESFGDIEKRKNLSKIFSKLYKLTIEISNLLNKILTFLKMEKRLFWYTFLVAGKKPEK